MRNTLRIPISAAAAGLALMGGVVLGIGPTAAAVGPTLPKPMHIGASGGDKTAVDKDGTQGSFTDSIQGKRDSDGDEDAFDLKKSVEATPQVKAKNKMTK